MKYTLQLTSAALLVLCAAAAAEPGNEFKGQREEVFEFARRPAVVRDGDRITITFESKAFCDATVAIEDAEGRIIRHLASGVLGDNAPAPFAKGARAQKLVWDSKDDRGRYVKNIAGCTIRVGLGLRARLERTLFWSPHKRVGAPTGLQSETPVFVTAPEGIYVYEGGNGDHLRLFNRDGDYIRTVYPFPADQLEKVEGLRWQEFPQDGKRFPLKSSMSQNTLLTAARLDYLQRWPTGGGNNSLAGRAMDVRGGRVVLANARLNRMTTDGASLTMAGKRLPLAGPRTSFEVEERTYLGYKGKLQIGPRSIAISPDGKWAYATGFYWPESWGTGGRRHRWLDGVIRVAMDGEPDAEPEVFAGVMKSGGGGGEPTSFRAPLSLVCDGDGNVYVADYMNDRVQVFKSDGKLLRSIPVTKPVHLVLDDKPAGGSLWVFSWLVINPHLEKTPKIAVDATLTRLGPLANPRPIGKPIPLPLPNYRPTWNTWDSLGGSQYRVTLDTQSDPPRVWAASLEGSWDGAQIRIFDVADGKITLRRNFAEDAEKKVAWIRAPHFGRQRLYCDPRLGWLYVGEQHLPSNVLSKSISELIAIDPDTGEVHIRKLPFDTEDLAFDSEGDVYLRTRDMFVRFDTGTTHSAAWREVPYDYGEERPKTGNQGFRALDVTSGVVARGQSWVSGQLGGMAVSPRGHIAVTYDVRGKLDSRIDPANVQTRDVERYQPKIYPGRTVIWVIHIFDERGKMVHEDALPGMGICSGLHIDNDDNIYVMASARRAIGGEPYLNDAAGTLIKAIPGQTKVLSGGGAVPLQEKPDRPADIVRWTGHMGRTWVENAAWLYGGVGLDSHGIVAQYRHCHCEAIARPTFDLFDRSFAPEINRYDVVAIDKNGNTIMRIGRYGNVDDGRPLVADGGPPTTRSIGGDEVAIVHGAHLATHTDHRLFVADLGNARVLSIKLDYHASEGIKLADVPGSPD